MPIIALAMDYLLWHYSAAYADIVGITKNFLWGAHHIFSLGDVIRSIFSPFKRLKEEKVSVIRHPKEFFGNLLVNILMRIVGFVIRTIFIVFALVSFVVVFLLGFAFLFLWTMLPFAVVYIFMSGLAFLFS
ncbi:MAG: hypothetical protein Q7S52_02855 [bacterium]|nr:hypothetical protein [bacterium]